MRLFSGPVQLGNQGTRDISPPVEAAVLYASSAPGGHLEHLGGTNRNATFLRKGLRRLLAEVPATHLERTLRRALLRVLRRPLDLDFAILGKLGLPRHGLVIDVGANYGFAIDAIRLAMPSARIVAFEPNPAAADYLERAFGRSVVVHRCALGARRGTESLYVPRYRRRVFDGLGSLNRSNAETWLRGRTLGRGDVSMSAVEVPVRTLDEFGLAPCLIKIDVQGTETAVVEGALETIRQHRPVLFVENPDAVLLEFLQPFRYRRFGLRDGKIDNDSGHTKNVLFVWKNSEVLRAISPLSARPGASI